MLRLAAAVFAALTAVSLASPAIRAAEPYRGQGMAMHGDLKYPPGFQQFGYVNSNAPKGGDVRLGASGSYDSFNQFIIKGEPAAGLGLIYDTLTVQSLDEPFSEYCLLCESLEMPDDRSWVSFTLRPDARWQDGMPITVDDVIWTFNTLREKGAPFYRFYYASVSKVSKTDPRTVRFDFEGSENRELPLIMGQLVVLPKHYWEGRDFTTTTLEPPVGSGPYRIQSFEPGRSVTYARDSQYWGADLPVRRGFFNFDRIRYDYYRDETVQIEAFKAGTIDFREENSSRHWATAYDIPAVRENRMVKEELPNNLSSGMQGFVYNMRRPIFEDRMVRRALAYAFDFEWSNKTLFYGQYKRTRSFFDNSELAARGLPQGEERQILARHRSQLPPEVFTQEYNPPSTDGSGNNREQLREALDILRQGGWDIDPETRKLTNKKTGQPMAFEVLLVSPLFERVVLPFKKNLARLGIEVSVRTVDSAQYVERLNNFDFDMIITTWGQSLSPGNEQRNFWGSASAEQPGSRNLAGVKDPVVDALIEMVISAPTREALVQRTHALDRVLQWTYLVIPQWHIPYDRVVYWNKFGRPSVIPESGYSFLTWWIDPVRLQVLEAQSRPATE